ncbi:MAG: ISKra4 family transposase, partial [Cyanobacteria bacterium J06621_11]
ENATENHASQFMAYLQKHRYRIINYDYAWWIGETIGSGEIESGIKQIAARVKLTGAQWKEENVPQVLNHRCAYLNGAFSLSS